MKNCFGLSLLILLASCSSKPVPPWGGDIFAGDSASGAVVRRQAGQAIPVTSPEFDKMRCMSDDDFQSWIETYMLRCQGWGK